MIALASKCRPLSWVLVALCAGLLAAPASVVACPFCSAVSLTLSEEMNNSDAVVLARLIESPPPIDPGSAAPPVGDGKARFEITEVLKGAALVGDTRQIDVLYFGQEPVGTSFLVMAVDPANPLWSTPIALSERAVAYVRKLPGLPESGADRLFFFQDYFEDEDNLLARDAYDEFARAPYNEVRDLKDRMPHDQLIAWINDPNISASHRRLYLTMLGVCGRPDDIALLEAMIRSDDRETKTALDALIACYLCLHGPDGLELIEDLFLKNHGAEYTDTYAAIMALRFHGQEDMLPRDRVVASMRHMLDRPQLADLVIPDLARWEDWSVVDQLVDLFKNADEESSWVRVPVIHFLRACPLPEARQHIDDLAQIDPDAVKRANSLFPLAAAAADPAPEGDESGPQEEAATPYDYAAESDAADMPIDAADVPADAADTIAETSSEPATEGESSNEATAEDDTQEVAALTAPVREQPAAAAAPRSGESSPPAGGAVGARLWLIPLAAAVAILAVLSFLLLGRRRHPVA